MKLLIIHNCHSFSFLGGEDAVFAQETCDLRARLAFRFYRAIGTLRTVDTFIALTAFQQAKIVSLGIPEKKIVLKLNCVAATAIEKHPRNGFLFVGHLDTYKGVEVLLQSWQEHAINYSLTIIEAMQNATPVIGVAIGTRNDFIRDGHSGFLTTPGKLAQTIEHATTFGGYVRMQRNARDFARQFEQETVTDAQIDLYKGLLV